MSLRGCTDYRKILGELGRERVMMERELDRRRGWPWKNRKNIGGFSNGSDGGSSPAPVKLFDEQVCIVCSSSSSHFKISHGCAMQQESPLTFRSFASFS